MFTSALSSLPIGFCFGLGHGIKCGDHVVSRSPCVLVAYASLDRHKQRHARLFGFCFGVYRQENRPRLYTETLLIFRRAKARNAAHAVPDLVLVLLAARLPRALPGLLAVAKACKGPS